MGHKPGLSYLWFNRRTLSIDSNHSPCATCATCLSRLLTYRASNLGTRGYAGCLSRRCRYPVLCRLDDPAPTWSRLERNAHSRWRVQLRIESQSEYPDYLKPGWTGRIYIVPLVHQSELNCYYRSFNGTNCCSVGPVYSASGRIRRLFATCSRIWAVQPATRLAAKVGVNISPGSPTDDNTTAE